LDGVVADMESELVRQAEILFGDEVKPGSLPDSLSPLLTFTMTTRQQRRLWRQVAATEGFWETLGEIEPGSVARLANLALERRWEIIFLTKRPATSGATVQVQSQRWLESKGFPLASVFVVQRSRGQVAAALDLDVVVDDRPENCGDVAIDSKARAILVWRRDQAPPETVRRLGVRIVKSVSECLDLLSEVDRASQKAPGMLARVMGLFGFR
jgi:hypothetical protein